MVNKLRIPLIVAINKIDREDADVESVMFDLENQGIIPEDLGGNIICVPISAKEKVNIRKKWANYCYSSYKKRQT